LTEIGSGGVIITARRASNMENNGTMEFTIGGKKIYLSKKSVENALKNVNPETISKYSVTIGQAEYPIKQALSLASGLPTAAFITTTAYRILNRLGFEVNV
jgi:hypothetical protein